MEPQQVPFMEANSLASCSSIIHHHTFIIILLPCLNASSWSIVRGKTVQGNIVWAIPSEGILSGGYDPGGHCPGGCCLGTIVKGDIAL